jgi:hypothetical protein
MDKLLIVLLLAVGALWWNDEGVDDDRIKGLEKQIEIAEARVNVLEGELDTSKSEYDDAIAEVESANVAINLILDRAGKDIDEGLNGIQKLKAINSSYDAAVDAIRGKCIGAVRRDARGGA